MSETLEPKVIHGKTIEEYKSKFGPDYDAGNLWDIDPKELNDGTLEVDPEKEYWEIDGRYYEAYPETSQNKSVKKENKMSEVELKAGETLSFITTHFMYKDKPVYFSSINVLENKIRDRLSRSVHFKFDIDVPLDIAEMLGIKESFVFKGEYKGSGLHTEIPRDIIEKYHIPFSISACNKNMQDFYNSVWDAVKDLSKYENLKLYEKPYRVATEYELENVFEEIEDVPHDCGNYLILQSKLLLKEAPYDEYFYIDSNNEIFRKKGNEYFKQTPVDLAETFYNGKERHLNYLKENMAAEDEINLAKIDLGKAGEFYRNVFDLSNSKYLEASEENAQALSIYFNTHKKEIETENMIPHVPTRPVYKEMDAETAMAVLDTLDIGDYSVKADLTRGNFFICDRQLEDVYHKTEITSLIAKAWNICEEWDRGDDTETENKYHDLLDDITTEEGRALPVQIDYEIHIPNHTFKNLCEKFGNMPEPDASGVFTTPFAVVWASIKDVFKTDSEYFWTETKAGKDETVMNIKALHDVIVDAHTTYDNFKFKELADNALNQPLGISLNNKLNSFDLKDRITFNAEAKKPNYLDLNGLRHEAKILDAANTFITAYKDVYKSENKGDFWSAAKHTEEKLNSDTIKLLKEYFAKNNIKTKSDYENFFKVISGSETKTEEKKKSFTKEKNISESFER